MRSLTAPSALASTFVAALWLTFVCALGCGSSPPPSPPAKGIDAGDAANASDGADTHDGPPAAEVSSSDAGVAPADTSDGTDPSDRGDASDATSDGKTGDAATGDATTRDAPAADVPALPGWAFVWSDEFDEAAIDESTWNIVEAPGTKANAELQTYTKRKNDEPGANSFLADGALVLEAREEALNGYAYTSARLDTQLGARQFQYGRFEARMKLPAVTGLWPAFWLLGVNAPTVGWPVCGEVDIMEGKGRLPSWTAGSLHRGLQRGAPSDIVSTKTYTLASGDFNQTWHVFAVEWDVQQVRWYVDDALFETVVRPTSTTQPWPFDQPFYILLNLAVGGLFDANAKPPAGTPPQRLYVDYVRVYQKQP